MIREADHKLGSFSSMLFGEQAFSCILMWGKWGPKELCLYGYPNLMIERGVWVQGRWRSAESRSLGPSCESHQAP